MVGVIDVVDVYFFVFGVLIVDYVGNVVDVDVVGGYVGGY